MTQIIDNFIEKDYFDIMSNFICGNMMDWYPNNCVTRKNDGYFQFVHKFYEHGVPRQRWDLVEPIMQKFNPFCILKVKANLLTKTQEHIIHGMHTDFERDLKKQSYKTAILYLNTNNGYTLFENEQKVKCIANRVVIFDGNKKHASVTQTDINFRYVININYIEYN